MNFSIDKAGLPIQADDTSVAHDLGEGAEHCPDIMIDNPGPESVYVLAGGASAEANTDCMRILPGEKGAYCKGTATHLAVVTGGGGIQQPIVVHTGQGS